MLVVDRLLGEDPVVCIHSWLAKGCMWDPVRVPTVEKGGLHYVRNLVQNPSHKDTLSLGAGQSLAQLTKYENIEECLDSDRALMGLSDYIGFIVTEPIEYTKTKQRVVGLPANRHLRKTSEQLHAETESGLLSPPEFKRQYSS